VIWTRDAIVSLLVNSVRCEGYMLMERAAGLMMMQTEEPDYWPPVTRDEKGRLIMCAPITNQDYLKANPNALKMPGVLSMAKCNMEAAPGVKATKPIKSSDFTH